MNPRLTIRRHGRALAVVGALVAVSATTTMALVAGTASAAPAASQPGKCTDNVNVRAEPTTTSKIVAVCETGKAVQVAETKDGFVHLTDLKGWASQEYVSVNGAAPAPTTTAPATTPDASDSSDTGDSTGDGDGTDTTTEPRTTPGTTGNDVGDAGDESSDSPDAGDDQGSDDSSDGAPSGGLLG